MRDLEYVVGKSFHVSSSRAIEKYFEGRIGAWLKCACVCVHSRDKKGGRVRVAVPVSACAGEKGTTAGQSR